MNRLQAYLNEDISLIAQDYQLALKMPVPVSRAAKLIANCEYDKLIASGRADLRAVPFVTIDGSDAKDFDDAVHCTANKQGGFKLSVAISDVAAFVEPSIIDREACHRANSTYFPTLVLPMLPASLSEDLCSLLPNQERLALVCTVQITATGQIADYSFTEGVIRSVARLTYTQADELMASPRDDTAVGRSLQSLAQLTHTLLRAREDRGALSFNHPTLEAVTDGKDITDFRWSKRLFAHQVIEENMLTANFCAARFLCRHKFPFLYRVHGKPEAAKVMRLRRLLRGLGIKFDKADRPSALQEVVRQSAKFDPLVRRVITMNVLRTLQRATYTTRNSGHFALRSDKYTHFTSPIRRYPDLLVHRAIKSVLHNRPPAGSSGLEELGAYCTERELASERAALTVLGRQYTRRQTKRVGQQETGVISGMGRGGMFVATKDGLEGKINFNSMADDYYDLDSAQVQATGRKSGRRFFIGQQVAVRISGISEENVNCRMELH